MPNWENAPIVESPATGGKWQDAPVVDLAAPPPGAQPGSKGYADWAAEQARAGKVLPQVSADPSQFEPGYQDPDWERATLLPMEKNRVTGERRWAAPQIAVDIGNAMALPGEVYRGDTDFDPRKGFSQQEPETLDRAANLSSIVGTSPSLAAKGMMPATTRQLISADGVRMPKLVADDLAASGMGPSQVSQALAELGPGARIGDLTPTLQGRTARLATMPGPARDIIVPELQQRKAQATERIGAEIRDIIGPEPIPSRVAADFDLNRKAIGPIYRSALADAKAVDTRAIAANLDSGIVNERGAAQTALKQVREMLNVTGGDQLDPSPATLLATRKAIDGMLDGEMDRNVKRVLTMARQEIDAELALKVPGIKQADAAYRGQAVQQDAFETGRNALTPSVHPEDLADIIAKTPEGVPFRIKQGMASRIYEILGTRANDRVALRQIITGDGKWNYQKLRTAFGDERASRLLKLFESEAILGETENLALSGSKTALLQAGGKGLEPDPGRQSVMRSALNMDFGDAVLGATNKVTGGAFDALRSRRNATIADALMSQGGWESGKRGGMSAATIGTNPAVMNALLQSMRGKEAGR